MLTRLLATTLILLNCAAAFSEIPDVNDFRIVPQFPQPAETAYGVVGTTTSSGLFVLWDGDTVYKQPSRGSHELTPIATGYLGDPGFLAMSPDGHTLLMGAGFTPAIYLLDLNAPVDFADGDAIDAPLHFSGTFLTSNLIILDRSTDDYSATELVILDLDVLTAFGVESISEASYHSVLEFPQSDDQDLIIEKPSFSYSAKVFVSQDGLQLYAMDGNTRELRAFLVADILDAFENSTTLDWATDGALIGAAGDFFSGGVSGENSDGELIISGSEGYLQPGGIMYVDPTDPALILATLDPAGNQPFYHSIYNQRTDELIAIDGTSGQPLQAYARESAIAPIPPRNPCDDFDDIMLQFEAFVAANEADPETFDLNKDGIPEAAILLLLKSVSCGQSRDLREATHVAYDLNLDAFDAETNAEALADYRELIALFMVIDVDTRSALPILLNDGPIGLALENDYLSVSCILTECTPDFEEKGIPTFGVVPSTTNEPYSGSGDLDNDGTSNLTEYNNVIANGGSNSDFVLAATSANLDGNSTLERHSETSSCFIATAAYGTPIATEIDSLRAFRDANLLNNTLGSAFVDTYYRLSPPIADQVAQYPTLSKTVRIALAPILFAVKMTVAQSGLALFGAALLLWSTKRHRRKKINSPATL